jgi:hypothetical protein
VPQVAALLTRHVDIDLLARVLDRSGEELERVPRIMRAGCGRPSTCCIVMI